LIFCLASSVVKFSSPIFLTISSNALFLASFLFYNVLFMFHRHSCSLYNSTYLHVNSSFHLAGILNIFKYLNTQIVLLQPKQIIRTDLLVEQYRQVAVHTRQVKGRLPAGIGGGRQVASKIELPSIHLPCLTACQATYLASKFRQVNVQTGQLTCSKLLVHLPCLPTGLV
jgi:hypothetical protein